MKTKAMAWGPWTYYWLGELCFNSRNYEKAHSHYKKAINILEPELGRNSWVILYYLSSIRAASMYKNVEHRLNTVIEYPKKSRVKLFSGMIANQICSILMNSSTNHLDEAEEWINKAIKTDESIGNKWQLACNYALYADLLNRKGNDVHRQKKLTRAIEIFQECGATGWVEKYAQEL